MPEMLVTVVGAGLAGCEAAWQLLRQGVPVRLVDMKPVKRSPAHGSGLFAELVCSNSLRSDRLQNAVGLLKEEMRLLDSLVIWAADQTKVPAGGALAVDRQAFSQLITDRLTSHPLLEMVCKEVKSIPDGQTVIATGPLTSDDLADALARFAGQDTLHFYDAAAPIVTRESIDMSKAFTASRYGRGDDYINCPMDQEEYQAFYLALLQAETAPVHGFEESKVFEGCMPIESLACRGELAIAYGPLKPVGLRDPRTGKRPYAVLQLRRDDASDTLYNLVGFQTRLKFPEQKRVFSMIPGLEHAEFARYGVMHRNTFFNGPQILDGFFQAKDREGLYLAGQITGVEGYVESAASGLMAGLHLARKLKGSAEYAFSTETALGALSRYVSTPNRDYQPMHITFGLIDPLDVRVRGKDERNLEIAQRALQHIKAFAAAGSA